MTSKRAAIYCRISADREGKELGVERQQEDCRALLTALGYEIVFVYIDNDISASTRSKKPRPSYRQMLADAEAGHFEVIVAYTSNRLTRRPREHEDLIELAERHGVQFLYVRSPSFDLNTAHGRLIARMLAASDAAEAEIAQERIRRAKEQASSQGLWRGGKRPFGYEGDGMTIRPDEAAELVKASRAVLAGDSINAIARDFNARGITTTGGKPWDPREIFRVLQRPRNAGLMEVHGEITGKAGWEPVVPEPLWRAVVATLTNPARRTTPGPARRWLGSGLYFCHCGLTVKVDVTGGKRPGSHAAYTCRGSKHLTRIASEVDALVGEVIVERLSRPDAADLVAADSGEDPTEALLQAGVLRGRLDELATLFATGAMSAAQVSTASAVLRRQLDDAEARIASASRASVLDGLVGAKDVGAAWKALGLPRRRAVINRLMTVHLLRSSKGRRKGWKPGESYFDPSSVRFVWKL